MPITPYLSFDGRAEEAVEFYKKALGAEVLMMMRFSESPDQSMNPPNSGDKIMHVTMQIKGGEVMASDGNCGGGAKFEGISLSYPAASPAEADKVFAALSEGGQVRMPLTPTFFSPKFGMVADKFGVLWMVIVPQEG